MTSVQHWLYVKDVCCVSEVGRDNLSRFGPGQHFPFSVTLWWWPGPKSSPRCNYQLSSMLTNLIICSEAYVCLSVESHMNLLKGTKTWHGYMLLFWSTAHQKTIWHVTSHIMLNSVLDQSWKNEMFDEMHFCSIFLT